VRLFDAPGIRAGTKIPSSALRRPGRYAHRNGRSRIDPWRMVPTLTTARAAKSLSTRPNGSGF